MKKSVALFAYKDFDGVEAGIPDTMLDSYIQLTEAVEIDFTKYDQATIVKAKVKSLQKELVEEQANAERKQQEIRERIQTLLALPSPTTTLENSNE